VLIDGIDVRTVTARAGASNRIVLQALFLFSATVMENIRFGNPRRRTNSDGSAQLAHADTFIERLPDK